MINKKFMILAIFLVGLLAVSAVSAADNATEDIVGVEETTDEVVGVNENRTISEDDVLGNSPGTFTDLANEIAKAGSTLNLNRNYAYTSSDSDYEEGITIDKTISINGNGYTINGINQVRAFKITASNVVLSNINFVNTYSNSNGGAIYWNGYNGILKDCSFVNSSIMYSFDGGSVYWNKDSGVLSGCSFMNSNGRYGGSVYWRGSNGVLEDCSFVKSGSDEGAVYWQGRYGTLKDCNFIDCSYHPNSGRSNQGGSVYWHADDGILCNCIFTNSYSKSEGGAIYWCGPRGSLSDCTFTNCRSRTYGGAIYLMGTNCTLLNSIFIEDSANYNGGAVEWYSGENGYMADCSFENCFAYEYGGSVLWRGDDCGTIYNCSFVSSSSGKSGGAVSWGSRYGIIEESIFINCHAGNDGGGISFSAKDCSLINSIFEGNTAQEGADWYSSQPLIVINETKTSTVITAPDVSTDYGVSKKLVATLKDINNNILTGETISIVLNNVKYTLKTNSKGQASIATPTTLAPNTYIATISYAGNDDYKSSSTTAKVTVNKLTSVVSADDVTVKYGDANGKFIATLTNAEGTPLSANIVINLNGVNYSLKTNSNGQASVSTKDLKAGEYPATVTYKGNSKYAPSSTTANVIIVTDKLVSVVSADDVTVNRGDASGKFIATLTNAAGVPLSANIVINLNGVYYAMKTNSKGQGSVSTAKLASGEYTATVTYKGNSKYAPSSTTAKVTVKFVSVVSAADVTVKYGDANGKFIATLTNAEGTPLSANIVINLNGVNYALKTNSKGQASVSTAKLKVGEYTATVTYKGNSKYAPSTTTAKVIVTDKLISKVSAEDVTVNYGDANGKFIATLTNAEGTPLSANIVINLNGVDYAMKTNSKGQASVSTKDLAPGEHKATVTYKGNSKYAPSTTTAKVTVKAPTQITGTYNSKTKEVIGTLTNGDGVPLSANVVVSLKGVNYALKSDSKGQFKVSAADFAPGSYTAKLVYKGNSKYAPSSATVKVVIQ